MAELTVNQRVRINNNFPARIKRAQCGDYGYIMRTNVDNRDFLLVYCDHGEEVLCYEYELDGLNFTQADHEFIYGVTKPQED